MALPSTTPSEIVYLIYIYTHRGNNFIRKKIKTYTMINYDI